jgi:hypothetical protein
VARVLKARYFPNSSFINANLGNNPSYSWKSLWKSREVLIKGCRWTLGDGRRVRVMKDPWIRGGDNWWVESPQREEAYDMTVDQLMLDGERKWDANKIKNLFSSETVNSILSMNLFQEVREDKFIWEGEKDGKYTVRAGYRSIMSAAGNRWGVLSIEIGHLYGILLHLPRLDTWFGGCVEGVFPLITRYYSGMSIVRSSVHFVTMKLKLNFMYFLLARAFVRVGKQLVFLML